MSNLHCARRNYIKISGGANCLNCHSAVTPSHTDLFGKDSYINCLNCHQQ
ncbi:MAG: hypothetical protein KGZ79_09595 [Dethiobacter sp.]|nr:hypothetical protein [Dethiobacter sp.]MBS4022655.1 hypothetical protein [Dethiobacter sp.]